MNEPIHDLARGDKGSSRQLSRALRVLMENTPDARLKNQLREVLDGKASARALLRNAAFEQVLDRTLPAAMQRFAEMPAAERQRLAEQGAAEAARLRSEPRAPQPPALPERAASSGTGFVVPGTRKPDRERVVTPDEDDEDDAYFRARQQRGWLE
ncbi:hypothetical protein AB0H71_10175 [Nocardia sp. NPDC050697]|uniref:hypothetical protein n=1 Tax=Nocardia sp. NPDC050697 TaxID=3155158 RepID=UPI0033CAC67E